MSTADTPRQIRLFQLISAKHAIGLEAKGMRHSRLHRQGGVRGLWARYYGMPSRSPAAKVIERIQQEIHELSQQGELDYGKGTEDPDR